MDKKNGSEIKFSMSKSLMDGNRIVNYKWNTDLFILIEIQYLLAIYIAVVCWSNL